MARSREGFRRPVSSQPLTRNEPKRSTICSRTLTSTQYSAQWAATGQEESYNSSTTLLKDNPKILLGYSDITFLHIAIYNRTGLVTFHGPSASHLDQSLGGEDLKIKRANLDRTLKLLSGKAGLELRNPPGGMILRTLHDGKASGLLMGGNLETLEETLATPYEIGLDNCLFFFEDVHSSEEMVDRALTNLSLAGKLDNLAGVIVGEFSEVPKPTEPVPSMEEVLQSRILPLKKPAIHGLQCGHGKVHVTLPLGVRARLDADEPSLKLLETPVD